MLTRKVEKFESDLMQEILNHTEGFVFKDIEKMIDRILLNNWQLSCDHATESDGEQETLNQIDNFSLNKNNYKEIIYNYTCINMLETKFYKAKNKTNWKVIGGLESVKNSLIEAIIWPIKYKELYQKLAMKQSG